MGKKQKLDHTNYVQIACGVIGGLIFFLSTGQAHIAFGFVLTFAFASLLLRSHAGREFSSDRVLLLLFLLALVLDYTFFSVTDVFTHSSDIRGHILYARALADGHFPGPTELWQSYQPPLYYLLAAPFAYLDGDVKDHDLSYVRIVSELCYAAYLIYGIALISLFIKDKWWLRLASAMLVLWPVGIVYSGKLTNDSLSNALVLAGAYYLMKWWMDNKKWHLTVSVFIALVCIMAKSTALLLCMTIAICVGVKLYKRQTSWKKINPGVKILSALAVVAVIAFSVNFGRTMWYSYESGEERNLLVGNMTNANYKQWKPAHIEDDSIGNYIWVDPAKFVSMPYAAIYGSKPESDLFWNIALKSLLTGIHQAAPTKYSQSLNFVYLMTIIFMLYGVLSYKAARKETFPLFVLTALSFAGMAFMRIQLPVTGFAESRYVHYIVPYFIIALVGLYKIKDLRAMTRALAIAFTLMLAVYDGFLLETFIMK